MYFLQHRIINLHNAQETVVLTISGRVKYFFQVISLWMEIIVL